MKNMTPELKASLNNAQDLRMVRNNEELLVIMADGYEIEMGGPGPYNPIQNHIDIYMVVRKKVDGVIVELYRETFEHEQEPIDGIGSLSPAMCCMVYYPVPESQVGRAGLTHEANKALCYA